MTRWNTRKSSIHNAVLCLSVLAVVTACGYRFGANQASNPFPADIKTIVIKSAINNTTVTGIETELTNDLRQEFALGTRLRPVRSGGQVVLDTIIATYDDTPAMYKADGRELTRVGTLKVACNLKRTDSQEKLWQKVFAASHSYLVTDSIAETLSNRRRAISRMIKDLIVRIHTSLYDNF